MSSENPSYLQGSSSFENSMPRAHGSPLSSIVCKCSLRTVIYDRQPGIVSASVHMLAAAIVIVCISADNLADSKSSQDKAHPISHQRANIYLQWTWFIPLVTVASNQNWTNWTSSLPSLVGDVLKAPRLFTWCRMAGPAIKRSSS